MLWCRNMWVGAVLVTMSLSAQCALYRFVKQLGPEGVAAPAYLPPGQEAKGPFVLFPQPPK